MLTWFLFLDGKRLTQAYLDSESAYIEKQALMEEARNEAIRSALIASKAAIMAAYDARSVACTAIERTVYWMNRLVIAQTRRRGIDKLHYRGSTF